MSVDFCTLVRGHWDWRKVRWLEAPRDQKEEFYPYIAPYYGLSEYMGGRKDPFRSYPSLTPPLLKLSTFYIAAAHCDAAALTLIKNEAGRSGSCSEPIGC